MKKQVELDRQIKETTSRFELFKTAPNRRRALVGFMLMWNNQFTGVLIVGSLLTPSLYHYKLTGYEQIANYGVILYIALGMGGYMPLLLSALWVTSTFPGNILCAFFIEKVGRRPFLLTGLCGILFCLICETALQATYLSTNNKAGQNAAIFVSPLAATSSKLAILMVYLQQFIFLFITPFWSTFMDASQFLYVSE